MAWQSDGRMAQRDIRGDNPRKAYRAGYSDGFHHAPKWQGNDRDWYPQSYEMGYADGKTDAPGMED